MQIRTQLKHQPKFESETVTIPKNSNLISAKPHLLAQQKYIWDPGEVS
jgi:hypothetical protein